MDNNSSLLQILLLSQQIKDLTIVLFFPSNNHTSCHICGRTSHQALTVIIKWTSHVTEDTPFLVGCYGCIYTCYIEDEQP